MDVIAEGVESLKLACSLILLLPALGVAFMGRRRVWLVPAWIVTVTLIAWLRFVDWWRFEPSGPAHIAAGFALVGLVLMAFRVDRFDLDLGATVGAAFLAGWTWVPCVGSELGEILNNAHREPWNELLPTFGYFVGLFLPLIAIAALPVAWPSAAPALDHPRLRHVGLAVLGLVGLLVAVTLLDDVASELLRISSF